ncbi:metallophosphoesterase [Streptomyces sp. NBC_01498]|uniref:metallophosphoesterase n=1 Tax=Streptomyces sp. NBC_01498 TaxID=2975870 RepID=UPI002E7BB224|nr:metallophosphoesterase [Streptomyces sp. NBC_01498]WTL28361.1 metallophosphoesterase [Streptomyces sp. NBC_01498]
MSSALFVALVLPLLAAVHYYVWRRTVRDTTTPGSWWRRGGTALIVVLGLLLVAAPPGERGLPVPLNAVVGWPGFVWMAGILYLTLALLAGEVLRLFLLRAERRRAANAGPGRPGDSAAGAEPATRTDSVSGTDSPEPAPAPAAVLPLSRRLFVGRTVALVSGAAATATVGYGAYTALGPPRIKHLTVPLARLDPAAHGFRIALISDIHLNVLVGRSRTRQLVDLLNDTGADLVALVGDLVEDADVADQGRAAEPLADLRAPHGAFYVTGNHEFYSGADQWVRFVRGLGLRTLRNERVALPGFDLAGVDDASGADVGEGPDYEAALGGRDRDRAVVLLAHQPVQVEEAARYGVDLQLSGHTHGGQLWPFTHLSRLANPSVAGLSRHGDTLLYVTRGTGFWGPPVRLGADPDITVVELASPRA